MVYPELEITYKSNTESPLPIWTMTFKPPDQRWTIPLAVDSKFARW